MEQASYVPPPPDRIMEFLYDLENYMHQEEKDRLVQLAIIHAQFEIIHPFLDGNGRLGRILIPVYLVEVGRLNALVFYISEFLDFHRDQYYFNLSRITSNDDWETWIEFFLTAISEQAKANAARAKKILDVYQEMKVDIDNRLKSRYAIRALDTIFERPILTSSVFVKRSGIARPSAARILRLLCEARILEVLQVKAGRSPAVFGFPRLLSIME